MRPSSRWRTMFVPPRSGAENMARDSALMDMARDTGQSIFSVYSWQTPTLSFGRNQSARHRYDLREIERRGIDVVRRPTGGRALLHWREVTYSVAAPLPEDQSLAASYERINKILLVGLDSLGVKVSEARGGPRISLHGDSPCFAAPADGELVSSGLKLAGSAQVREKGALLQHGSILLHNDQPLISSLLLEPGAETPRAATLTEALGREPAIEEVADALFGAVMSLEDPDATGLDETEAGPLTAAHLDHYRNSLWTWRR